MSGRSASEGWRLACFYGAVALLHVAGWGVYLYYSRNWPSLVGLGSVAYMLGLRHAFDADHIAAIDDSVRFLVQKGIRPLGTGFFFSLGHSTVVAGLATVVALTAEGVDHGLPVLHGAGSVLGNLISGLFLWGIGVLNLLVLLDLLGLWRRAHVAGHDHKHFDELLKRRGLVSRLLGGRFQRVLNASWQLYPLGLLFGLGFDTASEIVLLAMTAGTAMVKLPIAAALSLPLLFGAGMTLMDTTDGVVMTRAYGWAQVNPMRKVFYNATTTGLSVLVALLVGTVELVQVGTASFGLHGSAWDAIAGVDVSHLGFVVVGLFAASWGLSVAFWTLGRRALAVANPLSDTHEQERSGGVA